MTFQNRVRRRWIASVIFALSGFALVELLVFVMLAFVVFVALDIQPESARRLLITIVEFLVGGAFLLAYSIRGMQNATLDTLLQDAGPLEREVIRARIVQEGGQEWDSSRFTSSRNSPPAATQAARVASESSSKARATGT